jgi:3-hydroxy-3-methylglutaryl CoA synthase
MLGAGAIAALVGSNLIMTQPAEARSSCYYIAHDPAGKMMADGHATAAKKSWACNRAERRCKRELERKRRHGKAGRGSCMRVTNY